MRYILERREHTAIANVHVEVLCVGGVVVLSNAMAKLPPSDAYLTALWALIMKWLVVNVC